jgi:hypothetical protein
VSGRVGEVRHANSMRAAGLQRSLQGEPDVIDMRMHVPQPVSTHDDHRVAERVKPCLQRWHHLVRGVEQEHQLIAGPGTLHIAGRRGDGDGQWMAHRPRLGPASGDCTLGRVEQDDQAAPAGVDDPSPGEQRHLLRRARQCGPSGGGGSPQHHVDCSPAVESAHLGQRVACG